MKLETLFFFFSIIAIEIGTSEETQTMSDSMLTASDCGRAQFVGIQINTFAIRPASSMPSSA